MDIEIEILSNNKPTSTHSIELTKQNEIDIEDFLKGMETGRKESIRPFLEMPFAYQDNFLSLSFQKINKEDFINRIVPFLQKNLNI